MGRPSTKKFTASQKEIVDHLKRKSVRKPHTFRLDEELMEKLGEHCESVELPKTVIIEYLLRKYLGEE